MGSTSISSDSDCGWPKLTTDTTLDLLLAVLMLFSYLGCLSKVSVCSDVDRLSHLGSLMFLMCWHMNINNGITSQKTDVQT